MPTTGGPNTKKSRFTLSSTSFFYLFDFDFLNVGLFVLLLSYDSNLSASYFY